MDSDGDALLGGRHSAPRRPGHCRGIAAGTCQPGVEVEIGSTVAGWDEHRQFNQRVRNHTKKPIEVEIRRSFPGHIAFRSALQATSHDFQTVQYKAMVKPGQKADLIYEVLQHQGRNAKQNSVVVEEGPVTR